MIMVQWIRLKDRKPDLHQPVLISDGEYVATAKYDVSKYGEWWYGHGFSGYEWEWDFVPTHWAPLVTLPEEDE